MKENILCFPANVLDEVGLPDKWSSDLDTYFANLIKKENLVFLDRDLAENDPSFKQIIPYNVVTFNDRVFVYRRGKKGGENRLHSKLSLGIGGHINDTDVKADDLGMTTYINGANREIVEELDIKCNYKTFVSGVIYDNSNDVGMVHFGVVQKLVLDNDNVEIVDDSLDVVGWMSREEVLDRTEEFETWSQIVIERLLT